jgi:hypothetical protein
MAIELAKWRRKPLSRRASRRQREMGTHSTRVRTMVRKQTEQENPQKPTVKSVATALNQAAKDAIKTHVKAGVPMATWQDGRVIFVLADTLKRVRDEGERE